MNDLKQFAEVVFYLEFVIIKKWVDLSLTSFCTLRLFNKII